MLITQDYGCELFKYLLEENKNEPIEYESDEHKVVLDMIISGKIDININNGETVEHIFKELCYFGCNPLLHQLYEQINYQIYQSTVKKIRFYINIKDVDKKHLKYIEHFTEKDLRDLDNIIEDLEVHSYGCREMDRFSFVSHLVQNKTLGAEFWKKHIEHVYIDQLYEVFDKSNLDEEFFDFAMKSDAEYIFAICMAAKLSDEFLEKHIFMIDWPGLSHNTKISERFFEKYIDKLNWNSLSNNNGLSEKFFERHLDKVVWWALCENTNLSEEFFEKYLEYVEWEALSGNSNISEKFIRKYIDRVDWNDLCQNINISEEFWLTYTDNHIDAMDFDMLCYNQNLTETYFEKYIERIDMSHLQKNKNISAKFWIKHKSKIKDYYRFWNYGYREDSHLDIDDPRHPKNTFSIKYWMQIGEYFSFDKLWKTYTKVI